MRDMHASISALFQARRFLLPASISCAVLHSPRGEVGEPLSARRAAVVEFGWRYRRPQDLSMPNRSAEKFKAAELTARP